VNGSPPPEHSGIGSAGTAATERVSIVMPAYNAARFIEEAIRSVQAQTESNWELLVVDDGSSDGTPVIVERLAASDPRIRLLRTERRQGPGPARNAAMDAATGRWLGFLDSDDRWRADKLERQLRFMRETGSAFCVSSYRMIDAEGLPLGREIRIPERIRYRDLLKNTIIAPTMTLLERARIGALRMPALPQHEDLAFWYSILRTGEVARGLPEVLADYRVLSGSASRDKLRSAGRMWNVYRRVERLSVLDSAWCYAHYAWNAWNKYRGLGSGKRP
jgi:teichuronic acid biosynthesis glycosyltransferase TuaG